MRGIRTAHARTKLGALWTLHLQWSSNFEAASVSVQQPSEGPRTTEATRADGGAGIGSEMGREVVKP